MAKRLAIAISGAVSLGSYEAGVLFETIRSIGYHNTVINDPQSEDHVEIDVITGASAGAMTAAIAARALLADAGNLENSDDNYFYNPWVTEVDITSLLDLKPSKGDDASQAILSSYLIDKIAEKFLNASPSGKKHPASAEKILLGISMSNLNGVDYSAQNLLKQDFSYTKYQDEMITEMSQDNLTPELISRIRNASISSGAFPFAFAPREVHRTWGEYIKTQSLSAGDINEFTQQAALGNLNFFDNLQNKIAGLPAFPPTFPNMLYTANGFYDDIASKFLARFKLHLRNLHQLCINFQVLI